MSSICDLTLGTCLDVRFPRVNKNNTLSENDERLREGQRIATCRVRRIVQLDLADSLQVSTSLMEDRPSLWGRIGGQELSPVDQQAFQALCRRHGADADDWTTWAYTDVLLSWFQLHCTTPVVAVISEGMDPFFVNTEGYGYARYVGRAVTPIQARA